MKLILKIAAGIVLALVLLVAGCGVLLSSSGADEALSTFEEQTGIVRVDAPNGACWSGAIGDSSKEGCGSKSFTIEGEAIISANAQKQDDGAWTLRLTLEIDGEVVDESETSAEYGVATVVEK